MHINRAEQWLSCDFFSVSRSQFLSASETGWISCEQSITANTNHAAEGSQQKEKQRCGEMAVLQLSESVECCNLVTD